MILGARTDPTMKPTADGSDQTAASIGDSPRTSCRYCAMKRKYPTTTKMLSRYVPSEARERANPEEAHVDDRRLEVKLAAHEHDAQHEASDDREDRHRRDSALRELLQPEDHGEDGEKRQRHAAEVEAASIRVPVLGQGARAEDEQQSHHRDTDQEDRAPPEELEEHAAEHRADRAARGVGGDPEPDRGRALLRVEEHREDQ